MQKFFSIARLGGDVVVAFQILFGLWGFVRALGWGQGDMTPGLSLTPGFAMQIYAALVGSGLVFLVGLHWQWFQSKRPAIRFKLMSEDIIKTRQLLSYGSKIEPLSAHIEPMVRKIAHGLDSLNTPYPEMLGENAARKWLNFLIRLQAASESEKLDYARSIWRTLQVEMKEGDL